VTAADLVKAAMTGRSSRKHSTTMTPFKHQTQRSRQLSMMFILHITFFQKLYCTTDEVVMSRV